MAIASVNNFNQTRDQICRKALIKVGAIQANETPSTAELNDTADALNSMITEWDAIGIHVWTQEEAMLFTQPGQNLYYMGFGTTDNFAQQTSWVSTTLSNTGNMGDISITVGSINGIIASGNIGIVLETGNIFWTTVNGSPSGNTVNLSVALPSVANQNAPVYFYSTPLTRALRVPAARRYLFSSTIETPMIRMSRQDYMDLPNKNSTGEPTQFFYDPNIYPLGWFYLWPTPVDATNGIRFTWYRPINTFQSPSDTPDLPNEWISTLIFNLAVEIAPEYGTPDRVFDKIKLLADQKLDRLTGWDREPESVYMGMDFDQTSRN